MTGLLLIVFQGATNDLIAAGLNLFWAGLTKLLPEKIVYVLGSGGNYLTSFDTWPTPTSETLYLAPDSALVLEKPAAAGNVTYVYDPSDPAPTFGGWVFQDSNPDGGSSGSVDQALLRERSDVIHFDGAPLAAPLPICGAVSATLAVGSTANDTDFIVRLVDQHAEAGWRRKSPSTARLEPRGRAGHLAASRRWRGPARPEARQPPASSCECSAQVAYDEPGTLRASATWSPRASCACAGATRRRRRCRWRRAQSTRSPLTCGVPAGFLPPAIAWAWT